MKILSFKYSTYYFLDLDECSKDNGCDKGAYCENTVGGYNCVCKEGYKKTEDGSCEGWYMNEKRSV